MEETKKIYYQKVVAKEERDKALGQFRLQGNGIMRMYNSYGLGVHIPETIASFEKLALQLHERLNGNDVPIKI